MSNYCPQCQSDLVWDGAYRCQTCQQQFKKVGECPDCDSELEKLQACGSASYFCNQCNELKSKSRVSFQFIKID
ncbi:DNA ligase [Vibrio sp. 10N.286.49.B3]|nr:DNA ligase [Vibrio sp. 10N.286.49.B3]